MKICQNCKNQLDDAVTVCPKCGSEDFYEDTNNKPVKKVKKKKQSVKQKNKTSGTVFGVLGAVLPFIGLSAIFVVGMLSFIFSFSFIVNDITNEIFHFVLMFATAAISLIVIPVGIMGFAFSIYALTKKKLIGILGLLVSIAATAISTLIMAIWVAIVVIVEILKIVIPIVITAAIVVIIIILAILLIFFGMPLIGV